MRNKSYVKVPTILQMEDTECGAACLGMILAYYGRSLPLELLRTETDVSRDGVSAKNISKAAKKNGLDCRGYLRDAQALQQIAVPCILHWNSCHFVVFEGIKHGRAYINDPAHGRYTLSMAELEAGFSNVVLTFAPNEAFTIKKRSRTPFTSLLARLKGYFPILFKLFFAGLMLVFPGVVLSVLSQIFMDDVLGNGYTDWIVRLLVFMACALLLKMSLSFFRSFLLQKFKSQLIIKNGVSFIRHLFCLPIPFFAQRKSGDLVCRVDDDATISEFLAGDLVKVALSLITSVFYLLILFMYNPLMAGIGLSSVCFSILVVIATDRAVSNESNKFRMYESKLMGALCAGLSIVDTIKATGIERRYANRILAHQATAAMQEQRLVRLQQFLGLLPEILGHVVSVLLLLAGGYMVIYGKMTLGMLLAFHTMFDLFREPVEEFIGFFTETQKLRANINRTEDVYHYPAIQPFESSSDKTSFKKLDGMIEIKEVCFGYSHLKPAIIKNLNLQITPGETVAFVGASGCGKSTIAKLISGLYPPWSGQIEFDRVPMNRLSSQIFYSSVSVVNQNIVLFSGTIRENITMWNDMISEEDVVRASRDACIHEFIMQQPNGYNTMLNENANILSGGQRQRIEIARALATNPTILIMDEATSALDPITEKKVMEHIHKRGCTCIIVAHRLSTIRDCNLIAVIEQGKIVQAGTHEDLFAQDGPYRALVKSV